MYSYLRYTDGLFDVFFFARCNIRASRETKKEIMSYRKEIRSRICVRDIQVLAAYPPMSFLSPFLCTSLLRF